MASILSGQCDDFEAARAVVDELLKLGMLDADLETFALNAPGQHARFPIGGDEDADRSAQGGESGAPKGAALGGAAGLALGTAAIPAIGPIAAAAGLPWAAPAFAGAVKTMGNAPPMPRFRSGPPACGSSRTCPQGNIGNACSPRSSAADVRSIEEAEGTWRDASWFDFGPVSVPRWIKPPHRNSSNRAAKKAARSPDPGPLLPIRRRAAPRRMPRGETPQASSGSIRRRAAPRRMHPRGRTPQASSRGVPRRRAVTSG
jgi:hypothetical protein